MQRAMDIIYRFPASSGLNITHPNLSGHLERVTTLAVESPMGDIIFCCVLIAALFPILNFPRPVAIIIQGSFLTLLGLTNILSLSVIAVFVLILFSLDEQILDQGGMCNSTGCEIAYNS